MRTALLLVSLLGTALAAEPAQGPAAVYELGVNGLSCPFCAYGIEKKLEKVEGVERLAIHLDEGVVRLTMAPGAALDEDRARRAVEEAGFTLRSFRRAEPESH